MATRYKLKRVTVAQKDYSILGDTVDAAKDAAGGVLSSVPVKTLGTVGGIIKGAKMGGIPGAIIGGIAGNALTKGLGNALKDN